MTNPTPHPGALARSYLFVPGDRPERFDKAWNSAADAVILDLEDAVPAARKDFARDSVRGWLRAERPVWIRCNACDGEDFEQDLRLAELPGVRGLLLPKARQLPAALLELLHRQRLPLIPIIESAAGFAAVDALLDEPQVLRLAFGAIDFQVDLGIEGDDTELLYFRSRLVLASRLAGKAAPVDGVTPAVDDTARIEQDTLRARRIGMRAKLCIHPRQVAAVHAAFAPAPEERAWAQRVIDAMRESDGAAVAVDGAMVDQPVLLRALAIAAAPHPEQTLAR